MKWKIFHTCSTPVLNTPIPQAEFESVVTKIRQLMESTRGGASSEIPPLSFSEKQSASPTSSTPNHIEELCT